MAPLAFKIQTCSRLSRIAPFQPPGITRLPKRWTAVRAGDASDAPSSSVAPEVESKEASLERLEASIRGKASPPRPPASSAMKPAKPIPIRGVTQQQRKIDSQYENMAEWREGQLFPEGWEKMSIGERVKELYLGRRGVLFWANKAAYASAIGLLGGWILFRFVGPALGLYKLSGEVQPPAM